jgi:hypothetical protein
MPGTEEDRDGRCGEDLEFKLSTDQNEVMSVDDFNGGAVTVKSHCDQAG